MARTRTILAATLTGLALAVGACGDDDDDPPGAQTNDAVVNDEATPNDDASTQTEPGSDAEVRTTRTDGE